MLKTVEKNTKPLQDVTQPASASFKSANDIKIVQIHSQSNIRRTDPSPFKKLPLEWVQFLFGLIDASILVLTFVLILPEVALFEMIAILIGVAIFILFKANLGGYSKKAMG